MTKLVCVSVRSNGFIRQVQDEIKPLLIVKKLPDFFGNLSAARKA